MSDWYREFANSGFGTTVTKQLGLPRPAVLRRYEPGEPLLPGPVVVGSAGEGRLQKQLTAVLKDAGVTVQSPVTADGGTDGEKLGAVILDATGLSTPGDLASAHDFLAPAIKRLRASGRVLILADPPAEAGSPAQAAARQALDGLVRSIGKELRDGSTANLVYVPAGAEGSIASPVRFFLSGRSAYVDGQVVTVSDGDAARRVRTTSGRWPARSPSSPAPRAASAPRSPGCWPGTARTSSPSTSRRPATSWPRSPTRSAGRRSSSTSPPPTPPSG